MKTLRDNNNNNSSSTTPSGHASDGISGYQASSTMPKDHSLKSNAPPITTTGYNPYVSLFNAGDVSQFTASIQSYLSNPQKLQPAEMINPLVYLQFLNANAIFMQQLAALQTMTHPTAFPPSPMDPNAGPIHYAAKARPMSQEELAEHARSIYQRALQRNQLQQQNDLMKHFYDSLHSKHQDLSAAGPSTMPRMHHSNHSYHDVPTVPNVSHIGNSRRIDARICCFSAIVSASAGTFDVLDTMIRSNGSPSSCLSVKEQSLETAVSSLSLLSADDTKMISNKSSTLDPSAPVFIPRHSGTQFDEDQETVTLLFLIANFLYVWKTNISSLRPRPIRISTICTISISFSMNFIHPIVNRIIIWFSRKRPLPTRRRIHRRAIWTVWVKVTTTTRNLWSPRQRTKVTRNKHRRVNIRSINC